MSSDPASASRAPLAEEAAASQEPPVHRVFYINLDRRFERRARFERSMRAHGLGGILSRFPAVDGRTLDLDRYPEQVVSWEGIESVRSPPPLVNGVHLTRGALGLILSYRTVLKRIAADPDEEHVYLISEDDAVPLPGFSGKLRQALRVLDEDYPSWDLLHVGYYDDDCVLRPIEGRANELLCRPVQVYGLFGAAVRPRGARMLLQHLFPLEEQIDSALAHAYDRISAFCVRPSLMRAQHSTASNTDIQILPEGFKFRG